VGWADDLRWSQIFVSLRAGTVNGSVTLIPLLFSRIGVRPAARGRFVKSQLAPSLPARKQVRRGLGAAPAAVRQGSICFFGNATYSASPLPR
jgi:hypothetical protein